MEKEPNTKNENKKEKTEILWIESDGAGYCLTEQDYNKRIKEAKKNNL